MSTSVFFVPCITCAWPSHPFVLLLPSMVLIHAMNRSVNAQFNALSATHCDSNEFPHPFAALTRFERKVVIVYGLTISCCKCPIQEICLANSVQSHRLSNRRAMCRTGTTKPKDQVSNGSGSAITRAYTQLAEFKPWFQVSYSLCIRAVFNMRRKTGSFLFRSVSDVFIIVHSRKTSFRWRIP